MNLSVVVRHVEQRLGHRQAIAGDSDLTYGRLIAYGRAVVQAVRAATGERYPRIALVVGNRWEYMGVDLGCALLGATLVRCNIRDSADDLAYILRDSLADAVIYEEATGQLVLRATEHFGDEVPLIKELPSSEEALEASGTVELGGDADDLSGEHLYRLMYTSGTTGRPKGVMVTHGQWRAAVLEHLHLGPLLDVGEHPVFLHVTPLSHVSGGLFWAFMLRGSLNVIAESTDVGSAMATARRHGVTHTFLVPTLINRLLDDTELSSRDLPELKRIYYAASPIEPARLREATQRFGPIFAQGYGSTEAMWWLTYLSPEDHQAALEADDLGRMASCGRPAMGMPVKVVDDNGLELPPGELGEIVTRGPHVATEYFNRGPVPRIGDAPAIGWFRTGDMGHVDAEGFVYLTSRKSDLIVTGGFNVYPREVEHVVSEHPAVAECCVVGTPEDEWGELIAALVVPRVEGTLDTDELLAFCKERLAGYKRPRKIAVVDALPTTETGKIDRKAVRQEFWKVRDREI